ncbi:MAG: phosphatidate cytidylyltransferase [Planctomycetota bacterium]|jgi:phosphatidate cytidylyltransferase
MRKRIIIGICLLVALLAIAAADASIGRPILSVLAIFLMTALAQREFIQMSSEKFLGPLLLTWISAAGAFACRWFTEDGTIAWDVSNTLLLLTLGLMFANLLWATFRLHRTGEAESSVMLAGVLSLFAFVYVALPMGFLQQIAIEKGVPFAALMVLVSKCGDMGGYLVGSKIGRHRVMPNVSPKKSWEGSVGGLLLTLAVLFIAQRYDAGPLVHWSSSKILVFGLSMNVATQMGDFAESMVKRCFKVKDSGDILPTFGGALDILDSLVFAMPVAAIFTCGIS